MEKEDIIEQVESHMLTLDRDRLGSLGWMRFEPVNTEVNKPFIIYAEYLKGNPREVRNRINMECAKYWRDIGKTEKAEEIKYALNIEV